MNEEQLDNASIQTVKLQEINCFQKKYVDKQTQTDPVSYIQVKKINFCQLFFLLIGILIAFLIYVDIQGKLNIQQQQLEWKKQNCVLEYEKQKCFMKLPAQKQYCSQLEQCINVDWSLQRGIELSGIVAEMINNFIEKINLRTYLLLIVPFIVLSLAILKGLFK